MRISDWSSDVCSSDLIVATVILPVHISRLRTQREIAELISGYARRAMTFLIVVGWASRIAAAGDQRAHLDIRLPARRGEVAHGHASGNARPIAYTKEVLAALGRAPCREGGFQDEKS